MELAALGRGVTGDSPGTEEELSDRRLLQRTLAETIRPERGEIPAFIFTSPQVYELELERIFARCWLVVAHESEVLEPGDYVTRFMGEDPVIVCRGEDGRIRVFLNVCRHRGMRMCRVDLGNTSHFRCPYHGFTYDNGGRLIGVPFQSEVYGADFDRSRLSLLEARCATYAGLVFATWAPAGETLEQYLGDMRWYLDLLLGRAEMEVAGPPQRWVVETNWKLPADNFASDAYHTATTHASLAAIGLVPTIDFGKAGVQISAGNGHGLGIGLGAGPVMPPELRALYERHLTPEQMQLWTQIQNLHATVFPNCSLLLTSAAVIDGERVAHTTLRLWQPRGPEKIEIWSWLLLERDADAWRKALVRRAYTLTFGSSGILEQDDTENWTQIMAATRGVIARSALRFDYTMGLGREVLVGDFPGPGRVLNTKFQEANSRAFFRRWRELVLS
ncbi:MAG TPA: aromatic ring-hydroxylating dioxygenase subunit alpha [bacterium]|nr:aromatic ring-hydroxylating dioxygenase subunit alpha [bacterium]